MKFVYCFTSDLSSLGGWCLPFQLGGSNGLYENHTWVDGIQQRSTRRYDGCDAFKAQSKLEIRHRREQGEMFRDFEKAREDQIQRLEDNICRGMKSAVDKLLMDMDTGEATSNLNHSSMSSIHLSEPMQCLSSGNIKGDIEVEKLQIEDKFHQMKNDQLKMVMSSVTDSERLRFDNLIDRHTQEMLELIERKVSHCMNSPIQLSDYVLKWQHWL